jgi:glc operon protein GlcG
MKTSMINVVVATLALTGSAVAQTPAPLPPYGVSIGYEQARKVMDAAEAEAGRNGWQVVIALVDVGGHLIHLRRLENVQTGSVQTAVGKATTSAAFRRPTKIFEDGLKDSPRFLSVPGLFALEGGLPIIAEGRVIGAIGVAGATGQQDAQIAQAGLAALR